MKYNVLQCFYPATENIAIVAERMDGRIYYADYLNIFHGNGFPNMGG